MRSSSASRSKPGAGYFCCIALVLVPMLIGCIANQPTLPTYPAGYTDQPSPRMLAQPPARPLARPKRDRTKPTPGETSALSTTAQPVRLQPVPKEATPEPPSADSKATEAPPGVPPATELVGIDQQGVSELLGPAMMTDSPGPAIVWHYKSSRCELDLVFYMEMRSGQMRTLHYDFKSGAENPQQRQACLKTIMEENPKGAAISR
jgi:hypothetical protein